ncbi:hypothetical protein ACHAWU_000900 [Discostella pseudostelligera]|uniref:DUF1995 domain-containing protein n=1 Tax=Discostella pseudostelligera TaxID=259834 RepID=A0ABD3M0H4_9STRA
MPTGGSTTRVLLHIFGSILLSSSFIPSISPPSSLLISSNGGTKTRLFSYAKIPSSPTDRDKAALSSIQSAIQSPRVPNYPYIECEFPVVSSLNKLGDGSLRSSLEVEDANSEFVIKLVNSLTNPFASIFGGGKKVYLLMSTSASNSLMNKVQAKVKKGGSGGATTVIALRDGMPEAAGKEKVCVFLTPSSQRDYQIARTLAEAGCPTVVVNASFKDQKSIPPNATMAYYLKPLTYNSQVAGYLIRAYPSLWTALDSQSKAVLGSFTDAQILVDRTNTPDLRESGRLVQKSVDERAIRARKG